MSQRSASVLLLALLAMIHAQLWLGRGSVFHVNHLQSTLQTLQRKNQAASQLNEQLASEIRDLKEGREMIEMIARSELGMIKPHEILVQYSGSHPNPDARAHLPKSPAQTKPQPDTARR